MAKASKKDKDEPKESEGLSPEAILMGELNRNKDDHYNFEEEVYYKVSTGSLSMDIETGGGINPGLFGVGGPFESGKTSFTLACMKNFLETVEGARGVYIKAESRLSPEMRERSGIKFVFQADEWKDGTCFVLETNIYEMALNTMRQLVSNNETKKRYFFFIDSMDGMTLRDDAVKEINESNKVAGAPLLTKRFLQKMANAMAKRGHICAISSQVSSNIQLDPYSGGGATARPLSGGGGFAKVHFANFLFEFQPRYQNDLILADPKSKPDNINNPILGHYVKILIKKSPNEKSGLTVSYPVKYGRSEGKSVWIEYEIIDALMMFELISKKGSWLSLDEKMIAELEEKGFKDVPTQLQGVDNWRKYLEEHPDVAQYLFKKFKKLALT